jgi:transcriptional regulator with XRE-family HTH domain
MAAARLRARRLALGLTQEEVADRAGIDRPTYNKIEAGSRSLTGLNASRIAPVLDTHADWLLVKPETPDQDPIARLQELGDVVDVLGEGQNQLIADLQAVCDRLAIVESRVGGRGDAPKAEGQ